MANDGKEGIVERPTIVENESLDGQRSSKKDCWEANEHKNGIVGRRLTIEYEGIVGRPTIVNQASLGGQRS